MFRGRIALPASPAPAGRAVGWSTPSDVVSIPFTTAFPYSGGTLCIDLLGRPVAGNASRFWAVDAIADPASSRVTPFGDACGPFRGRARVTDPYTTAFVGPRELVAACSASFVARGGIGMPGAFLFGFTPASIDLHALGVAAPGCRLLVADGAAIPTPFEDWTPRGFAAGVASVPLRIPVESRLFGARFVSQFVEIGAPLRTSNGLDCALAASLPALGMAVVTAPFDGVQAPARGRVDTGTAPVVRFDT